MAIGTYTDLVAELRDLQDNAEYSVDVINRAVRKAETYFLRKLRLSEMEVSSPLSVVGATASLPDGCREVRSVVWLGGGVEYPLAQMSLSGLVDAYGGMASDMPRAYAREGRTLRFAPVASGDARIVYYADLLPLGQDYPTNWLLTKAPDLYVAGAQYYLCRRERDDQGAQMALVEVDSILSALTDEAKSLAGGNLIPYAIAQVSGSRV